MTNSTGNGTDQSISKSTTHEGASSQASSTGTSDIGSSKIAQSAIAYATNAIGSPYSTAKRMEEGYYDCSSLVWRSFASAGFTFGLKADATNAPTAAALGQYCDINKLVIAQTYVEESHLKPGDILFTTGGSNGRYKNINHTAIYIGDNKIIHASSRGIVYGTYSYYKNRIVLIARVE